MLFQADGSTFAVGRAAYVDQDPALPSETSRIHVQVEFEGAEVLALLDTGSPWSIVNADLATALGFLDREGEAKGIDSRLGTIQGKLVRVAVTLVAEDGESVELESTVFVSKDWPAGNFVGYSGLLERVKFAIDPETNSFFFGPID